MIFRSQETNTKYHHFFYPEIKEFIEKQEIEKIEKELGNEDMSINFENKRKIGENEEYICELIRNDSIEQFVIYVNQTNLSLFSTKIEPSIFEANFFLMDKKPTLIEYAAFYGSLQIFNFLKLSSVGLSPPMWLYAIHSDNAELIHILEENHVVPPKRTYMSCYNESVKCHHNDIANYIFDVLLNHEEEEIDYKYAFKYHNYRQIPDKMEKNNSIFYYLCCYNYSELIKIYLKTTEKNIIDIEIEM